MNDLISRADLFNKLATAQDKADCFSVIQGMPTIDAEPVRHGHWIPWLNAKDEFGRQFTAIYMCSECKTATHSYQSDYCPDCGADMRGGDNT